MAVSSDMSATIAQIESSPHDCRLHVCDNSSILNGQYEYGKQLRDWLGNQFQWRLAYRASRDGWRSQDFYICCDNKGPTVTLVKAGDCIFGGYSDQDWAGVGWKLSNSSFLFSLQNQYNIPPFKSEIYQNHQYAVFSSPYYGPTFGGGLDLHISDNCHTNQYSCSNLGYTYQPLSGYDYGSQRSKSLFAGTYQFTPTEIEVFY